MAMFDIIKYEGPNDVFVWKHPAEDFNTQSQLIVHDSQEAVFFKDGQALDLFGGGRHTLSSDNIPFIRKLFSLGTGKKTPFHCEVYYVNKITSMNIGWGTESPIDMEDPRYRIFVKVRANGKMAIRVADSRRLLLTLVGTVREFNQATLTNYFKGVMQSKIKNRIANTMIMRGVSFLEVSAHLVDISNAIHSELKAEFEEYGIELVGFNVGSISVPDEDFAKLKAIKQDAAITMTQTDAEVYKTVQMGQAIAKSREAQGYSYQDERSFDVLSGAAKNQGTMGSMMGMGMGVGMGFGMGGAMGSAMGNMAQNYMGGSQNQNQQNQQAQQNQPAQPQGQGAKCASCKTSIPLNTKFCPECGAPQAQQPTEKFCASCGAKQPMTAKFCTTCGEKF